MTDNDDLRERAKVEQIDRDAAARYISDDGLRYRTATDIELGRHDQLRIVQAFARHRLTAIAPLQQRVERLEGALREARHFTATLAMYDGSAPLEDRFVSLPAIVARRAKSSLIEIDAALGDDVG